MKNKDNPNVILSFSNLDKFLILMLEVFRKYSIQTMIRVLYKQFGELIHRIELKQKFLVKVLSQFIFILFFIITCVIVMAIYFIIYIFVAALTSLLSFFLILFLGIYWGFLPFLIKPNITENDVDDLHKEHLKGHHILKAPINWSVEYITDSRNYFLQMSFRPFIRIQSLNQEVNETHIIERVSLSLASIISLVIYFGCLLLLAQILGSFFLLITIITLGLIYVLIEFTLWSKKIILSSYKVNITTKDVENEED